MIGCLRGWLGGEVKDDVLAFSLRWCISYCGKGRGAGWSGSDASLFGHVDDAMDTCWTQIQPPGVPFP